MHISSIIFLLKLFFFSPLQKPLRTFTNKKKKNGPDRHVTSSYGDGLFWHRTNPLTRPNTYGPTHTAVLKQPKFRHSPSLPVTMSVKSAALPADVALLKKELFLFKTLSNHCPFFCSPLGEETTYDKNSFVSIHNLLLEHSYHNLGVLVGGPLRLSEWTIRRITRDILEGVCCLHSQGYVHCGLTPEILLVFYENGNRVMAKIGDLGLVKRGNERKNKRVGFLRTNLKYLAPEVVRERVQEGPADIWAVGCMVMEMLTWRKMWEGRREREVEEGLARVGRGREVVRIPNEVSEEAKGFLMGCFDRKASRRSTAMMLLEHPFVALDGGGD